ncbi:MAG: UDP-3-O-[3-hydroxymyristoyl] N-acetylglucosamine deacetylase [Candidatus Frackibacter sp. T328-2]|nr:MAG: UDP-3-O-[3-hydroxymyristoyl] N-acetylglucosamine deacetylase [Candidatus Frackibacter sp. T328-2]
MRLNSEWQHTLKQEISYKGIGLHTGEEVNITCKPLPANSGIIFRRVDLSSNPEVEAKIENVIATKRSTTIGNEDCEINTTEHLLAALNGIGVDNLLIEIDANEVPVTDGSAKVFLNLLQKAGIKKLDAKRKIYEVEEAVWAREGDTYLIALPFPGFKVSYTFVSNHVAIGNQFKEFIIDKEVFAREVAPSRTFGFEAEIEALRQQGLALGGSLENAVLIGEEEIVNELRFADEIVRHKILDIIGDLALIVPFKGHIIAVRSGHALNRELAVKVQEHLIGGKNN